MATSANEKGQAHRLAQLVTLKFAEAGTIGNFVAKIRNNQQFVVSLAMNYSFYAQILSSARMSRYLGATSGNHRRAMVLYRLNISLGREAFGLLSIWEVAFRNAIDTHYQQQTGQQDWLYRAAQANGMFAQANYTCRMINKAVARLGQRYTHNRLIAEFTFGFWVEMFNRLLFRLGGQSLHHVFPQRPTVSSQQFLFNQLDDLREFRNRIAHHEPLCFNLANQKSPTYIQQQYQLLLNLTSWLGHQPAKIYFGLDHLPRNIQQLINL